MKLLDVIVTLIVILIGISLLIIGLPRYTEYMELKQQHEQTLFIEELLPESSVLEYAIPGSNITARSFTIPTQPGVVCTVVRGRRGHPKVAISCVYVPYQTR